MENARNSAPCLDPIAHDRMWSLFEEYMESIRREGANHMTVKKNSIRIGNAIRDYQSFPYKNYGSNIIRGLEDACNNLLIYGKGYLKEHPLIGLFENGAPDTR